MTLSATHDGSQVADQAPSRRIPPGVGLALGAAVSLGLWAALVYVVLRLVG
jgi:hypothetical protein